MGPSAQDLFYRLNVFPIEVPPLRERKARPANAWSVVRATLPRSGNGKNIRSIDKKAHALLAVLTTGLGNIREVTEH